MHCVVHAYFQVVLPWEVKTHGVSILFRIQSRASSIMDDQSASNAPTKIWQTLAKGCDATLDQRPWQDIHTYIHFTRLKNEGVRTIYSAEGRDVCVCVCDVIHT